MKYFILFLAMIATSAYADTPIEQCNQYKADIQRALDGGPRPMFIIFDRTCAKRDVEYLRLVTELSMVRAFEGLDELDLADGKISAKLTEYENAYINLKKGLDEGTIDEEGKTQALQKLGIMAYGLRKLLANLLTRVGGTRAMMNSLINYTNMLKEEADIVEEYQRLGFESVEEAEELERYLADLAISGPFDLDNYNGLFKSYYDKKAELDAKIQEIVDN